jgi:hypothetical protein
MSYAAGFRMVKLRVLGDSVNLRSEPSSAGGQSTVIEAVAGGELVERGSREWSSRLGEGAKRQRDVIDIFRLANLAPRPSSEPQADEKYLELSDPDLSLAMPG